MPVAVLRVWVSYLLAQGYPRAAAALFVCFDKYLRPTELLKLRVRDVTWNANKVILAVHDSKIGIRKGYTEYLEIDDQLVINILFGACSGLHRDEFLFNLNYHEFRAIIRLLINKFDLHSLGLLPYSFWRGGASFDFRRFGSFDRAFNIGRWASYNSAKLFITEALATVGTIYLPNGFEVLNNNAKDSLASWGVVDSKFL